MVDVNDDVSVKEYFEELVPKIFAEQLEKSTVMGMEGTVAKLMFKIKNEEAHVYTMVVNDAKDLEVVAGPVDDPLLTIELDESTWREAVTGKLGGAMDMFMDMGQMANRSRYDKVRAVKGTLLLDLERPGGSNISIKISFCGAETPQATFITSLDNWVQISTGQMPGVTAFMGGKLKIEGDMPFAVELSNVVQ